MLSRWHTVHHTGTTVDLINCPFCQDEFISWQEGEGAIDVAPDYAPADRLEELELSS